MKSPKALLLLVARRSANTTVFFLTVFLSSYSLFKGACYARQVRQKGFTLIELLVVVSIIALLIGLLLPALGGARKAAQKVSCASGMHQMSLHLKTYQADNHQYTMPSLIASTVVIPGAYTGYNRWTHIMHYYAGAEYDLLNCPGFPDQKRAASNTNAAGYTIAAYGHNFYGVGVHRVIPSAHASTRNTINPANWGPGPMTGNVIDAEVTFPSGALEFFDIGMRTDGSGGGEHIFSGCWNWYVNSAPAYYGATAEEGAANKRRHQGHNYLFYDGHVEGIEWETVDAQITSMWNRTVMWP